MPPILTEVPYLRDGLQWEDVATLPIWDATTAYKVSDCPRRAQHAIIDRLVKDEDVPPLRAGRAIHAGLAVYYAGADEDAVIDAALDAFGPDSGALMPRNADRWAHLHTGHIEIILKNYFQWARKHDTFTVLKSKVEDLKLDNVVAARWQTLADGTVVLGESKIIMEFDLGEDEPFLYGGRPDLPVEIGGSLYVMDHKSTNAYLSDWYFAQYRFSNQLRGYCAMIGELLDRKMAGAVINGVHMGPKASVSGFTGSKFARYGPMAHLPSHQEEALRNQRAWQRTLAWYSSDGFFPQNASRSCQGCPYVTLCEASPRARPSVAQQSFQQADPATMNDLLNL